MTRRCWEQLSDRRQAKQRHIEDGLFQIASQTCSLFLQINNTNNINYGDNNSNIQLNGAGSSFREPQFPSQSARAKPSTDSRSESDREQLVVLIPPKQENKRRLSYYPSGFFHKPRLSTVPETPTSLIPPENELWAQTYSLTDHDGSPDRWGARNKWCRPSCIPITIICTLIFLVVLLPVLDHATERALQQLNSFEKACNTCSVSLVESVPEGLIYNDSSITNPATFDVWMGLINNAQKSIDIASLYWTLRQSEVYPDPSSIKGEKIFQALLKAGTERGISIRIAQNAPSQNYPNVDTEFLIKRKAAQVRSLNFVRLLGAGVLHTKMWIIDNKHVYIGSANMDWRALTQVKEMGVGIFNCSALAEDASKIFEVYWALGANNSVIPDQWPSNFSTHYNMQSPLNMIYENETFQTFLSSSPLPFNPSGRTNDIDALLNVIKHAEKFVYIAIMDYIPLMVYTPKRLFWPIIDNAIRTVAIEHKVKVKLLISKWNHSRPAEDNFLRSIQDVNQAYPGVSIEVKRFVVPANNEQRKIPFARVNHNKYMVTDNTAYIGTSNWSGDYFTNTAGVAFVLHDPIFDRNAKHTTIRSELQAVFERDWTSEFAHPL
ncbi:5'-3' exonuclease PLD3-like isoform X1 [Euwallacea similis]|uniref:5'-3' exonuclease PLD3-like isoform X1 n=1 Tax=Euwallacea similis TaxID=1736056 RepID=UPI00344C14F7